MAKLDMRLLADRLRTLREERGLSQTALAARAKLNLGNVNELELQRKRSVRADTIVALADVLNVSADYLLGRADTPARTKRPRPRKAAPVGEEDGSSARTRTTPRHTQHNAQREDSRGSHDALLALHDALLAKYPTAEIVECGFFRGHPVLVLEGEDSERYANDLTPTMDPYGETVERPCVQCGLRAAPDGPDPCLGMLPDVWSACCGHGVEDPYVVLGSRRARSPNQGHRGQEALDFFTHHGVGPAPSPKRPRPRKAPVG